MEERRSERRAALLDTALELFGTGGYAATTIADVCNTSGVTSRYFYEEFGEREQLLIAVYDRELQRCATAVVEAASVLDGPGPFTEAEIAIVTRERVGSFVHAVLDDPRVARVLLLESGTTSSALERRRREAHRTLALFVEGFVQHGDFVARNWRIVSLSLVGAMIEVLTDWTLASRTARAPLDEVIDHLTEIVLFVRAGYLAVASPPLAKPKAKAKVKGTAKADGGGNGKKARKRSAS